MQLDTIIYSFENSQLDRCTQSLNQNKYSKRVEELVTKAMNSFQQMETLDLNLAKCIEKEQNILTDIQGTKSSFVVGVIFHLIMPDVFKIVKTSLKPSTGWGPKIANIIIHSIFLKCMILYKQKKLKENTEEKEKIQRALNTYSMKLVQHPYYLNKNLAVYWEIWLSQSSTALVDYTQFKKDLKYFESQNVRDSFAKHLMERKDSINITNSNSKLLELISYYERYKGVTVIPRTIIHKPDPVILSI